MSQNRKNVIDMWICEFTDVWVCTLQYVGLNVSTWIGLDCRLDYSVHSNKLTKSLYELDIWENVELGRVCHIGELWGAFGLLSGNYFRSRWNYYYFNKSLQKWLSLPKVTSNAEVSCFLFYTYSYFIWVDLLINWILFSVLPI